MQRLPHARRMVVWGTSVPQTGVQPTCKFGPPGLQKFGGRSPNPITPPPKKKGGGQKHAKFRAIL